MLRIAVSLCSESLDIDADRVLTHSLPYEKTAKIFEMALPMGGQKQDREPNPAPVRRLSYSFPALASKSSEAELMQ